MSGQLLDTCKVPVPLASVLAASTKQVEAAEEEGAVELAAQEASGAASLESAPSSAAEVAPSKENLWLFQKGCFRASFNTPIILQCGLQMEHCIGTSCHPINLEHL